MVTKLIKLKLTAFIGCTLAVVNSNCQTLSCSAIVSNNSSSIEAIIDKATNMVRDNTGSFIISGQTTPFGGSSSDILVSKVNAACAPQWSTTFNGTGNNTDEVQDMAVDASNNIYIAGNSNGVGSALDLITIKISAAGVVSWNSRYDANNQNDYNTAIGYSSTDNTIVTAGWVSYTSSPTAIVVRKLNTTTGAVIWSTPWSLASGNVKAYDLAIDNTGNIYVCGEAKYQSGSMKYTKTILLKFNSSGMLQWSRQYVGTLDPALVDIQQNIANKVKIDYTGYIYICGTKSSGSTWNGFMYVPNQDMLLIKYNSAGTQQWIASYNRAGFGDEANDMVFDVNNNIALAGKSDNGVDYDFAVYKVSNGGSNLWQTFFNGTLANSWDEAFSIDITSCRNYLVVCGVTQMGTVFNNDIITMRLDYSGAIVGTALFNQAINKYDRANTIIGGNGHCFVGGVSQDASNNSSLVQLKYSWSYLPCERIGSAGESILTIDQISVFNDGNKLILRIPEGSIIYNTSIYTTEGKSIMHFEEMKNGMTIDISGLTNGIYAIEVISSDRLFKQIKKFVVNK